MYFHQDKNKIRYYNCMWQGKVWKFFKIIIEKCRYEKCVKWLLNEKQIKWWNQNTISWISNKIKFSHAWIKTRRRIKYIRCHVHELHKHWSLKATNSNETLLIEKIRNNSFLNTFISGNFVPSFNGLLINVVINEAFILQLHHKIHLKPNTVIP